MVSVPSLFLLIQLVFAQPDSFGSLLSSMGSSLCEGSAGLVSTGSFLSLTNSVADLPAADTMASTLGFLSGLEEPTLESDPNPSGKRRRGRGSSLLHDTRAVPFVVIHS